MPPDTYPTVSWWHGPGGLRGSPRYAEHVFRRRSADAPEVLDQDDQGADDSSAAASRPGVTQGKGRPTPKRSEAERRRRQPFNAPADKKAAAQQSRERDRAARGRRTEA